MKVYVKDKCTGYTNSNWLMLSIPYNSNKKLL